MPQIVRNDEQIKVGITPGLVAGSSSFTFNGLYGTPNYIGYVLVVTEISGRGVMIVDTDYSWDYETGEFILLQVGDTFTANRVYNIHFQSINQPQIADYSAIINTSFFVRDITLPNTNKEKIGERFNSFIVKYEQECLKSILGYEMYKLFLNESSDRMVDLMFGAEYYDSYNQLQKWDGLVHDTDISLIANYIYYFIQNSLATQTTGISEAAMKTPTAVSMSNMNKMIDAWNFFSHETNNMICFLWLKKDSSGNRIYPEFTSQQFLKTKNLSRPINSFNI